MRKHFLFSKRTMTIFIVVLIAMSIWSLWGYFSSNVEQLEYTVIQKNSDYEIRNYPTHIAAQTTVKGSYDQALNEGFRILAGYIFGGNKKRESIAMTAPVIAQKEESETIAMTAPVLATKEGDSNTISFGMPHTYSLETLPIPNDSRIKLIEVPSKKFAVLRFSWFRTDARLKEMESKLLKALSKDSIMPQGLPFYAGYNAPWTPPWMIRNEVMVEVL